MNRIGTGALGAVGLAAGAYGVYESASGQGPHSWMDVASGTLSGATAAAGGAAIINAIPVGGQIGYGVALAAGAVVGGAIAGSQLFSETDCLQDPVLNKFTCCHTQFNQGERYADIGDYMFCGVEDANGQTVPQILGVRQCLQGGKAQAASWWDGLWQDDEWSPECTVRLCDNVEMPGGDDGVQWYGDPDKICWMWTCVDGYHELKQSGKTYCVPNGQNELTPEPDSGNGGADNGGGAATTPSDAQRYDKLINQIKQEMLRLQKQCM